MNPFGYDSPFWHNWFWDWTTEGVVFGPNEEEIGTNTTTTPSGDEVLRDGVGWLVSTPIKFVGSVMFSSPLVLLAVCGLGYVAARRAKIV